MKHNVYPDVVTMAAVMAIVGFCISWAYSSDTALPRFSHPLEITNSFLPLGHLKQDVLQSKTERVERTAKPELHKTFKIGGQTVEALVIEDREFQDGKLAEVALD